MFPHLIDTSAAYSLGIFRAGYTLRHPASPYSEVSSTSQPDELNESFAHFEGQNDTPHRRLHPPQRPGGAHWMI